MKTLAIIILILVLLLTLLGCSAKPADLVDVKKITLQSIILDPADYKVFVITPNYMVSQYDFTAYWIYNIFDYFSDSLPNENEYSYSEWRITEDSWNYIVEALGQNLFFELPEDISLKNGEDYPIYYIEVEANGITHKSGGYGAGYNKDKAGSRFKNILNAITESLDNDIR